MLKSGLYKLNGGSGRRHAVVIPASLRIDVARRTHYTSVRKVGLTLTFNMLALDPRTLTIRSGEDPSVMLILAPL